MSLKLGQIQPLVFIVTDRVIMGKNGVSTFSQLFFIRSYSYLKATMTWSIQTAELAALERLKKNPHRRIMGKMVSPFFLGCS